MQVVSRAIAGQRTALFRYLIAILFLIAPVRLLAEARIALVIGNGAYTSVTSLQNPTSDANLIAGELQKLGFQVTLLTDAGLPQMRQGFAAFGQALRTAGSDATGLFYYAGHGVQSFGANYLVPVDARISDAADLDLVAIDAQTVLRQMASARNRTNIFILDACRNNPFQSVPELNENGLAEMKAPTGTFLAYATAPGAVALDGATGHSPFTEALAAALPEPGVGLEQLFKQVRNAVLKATGGLQTPWDTSSMTQDFYFAGGALEGKDLAEEQLWTSVKLSRDPVQIMLFMRGYPEGRHFAEARELLSAVMQDTLQANNAPPQALRATPPPASEKDDFTAAQEENSIEGWKKFLAAHPGSVFQEAVETELAALEAKAGQDATPAPAPAAPAAAPTVAAPAPAAEPTEADLGAVAYDVPLVNAGSNLTGKRISEVLALSPIYPPIEGLPEQVWKGKHCTDCHKWDRRALCDQGKFFVDHQVEIPLGEIHPLGGYFRRVLKVWASQGCQ
jgi:hypothetical protein